MQETKLYKLRPDGASYNAAFQMQKGITEAVRELQKDMGANISREQAAEKIEDVLTHLDKSVIDKAGLSSPVVQIKHDREENYPRAYAHTSKIFVTQMKPSDAPDNAGEGKSDLYMYVPVGYNGAHFIPEDARLIDDPTEEQMIGNMLFAGGFTQPAELYAPPPRGVETPDDYIPLLSKEDARTSHDTLCFIAQGAALEDIEDYEHRVQEFRDYAAAFLAEVSRTINEDLREEMTAQIDEGESFYINMQHGMRENEQGEVEFCISPRRGGETQMMQAGQKLELQSNDFFLVEDKNGEYRVKPNTQTPQGEKLTALMQAVPSPPDLSEYPDLIADLPFTPTAVDQLLGNNGHMPRIDEFEGHKVLIYNTDDEGESAFTPPDSIYLPSSIMHWLRGDQEDQQMGITPPPQPEGLKLAIMAINDAMEEHNNLPHDDANLSFDP